MNEELRTKENTRLFGENFLNPYFLIPASRRKGFGLIEILIAVTVITLVIIGFGRVAQTSFHLLQEERSKLEAVFLAEEAIEAIRALRDQSWSQYIASLTPGSAYYVTATSTWGIWATEQPYINGRYDRAIRLDLVNRESGTDRIVTSGGTLDPGTRKLTVTVSWRSRGATTSVSSVTYVTNFLQN